MVLYQCERCIRKFNKKIDFTRHCNRKFPCIEKNRNIENSVGIDGTPLKTSSGSKLTPLGGDPAPNSSVFPPIFLRMEHPKAFHEPKIDQFKIKKVVPQKNQSIQNSDFLRHHLQNFKTGKIENSGEMALKAVFNDVILNETCEYQCIWCNKKYSKNSNLNRHLKKCPTRLEREVYRNAEIDSLKNELEEIKTQNKSLKETLVQKQTTVNITNTYNDYRKIININAFGKENLSFLKDEQIRDMLSRVMSDNIIPKLVKYIHCNPDIPENMNIYKPNKKDPFLMLFDGSQWTMNMSKRVIDNLIEGKIDLLDQIVYSMSTNIEEDDVMDKIQEASQDEDKRKGWIDSIAIELYNNREKLILNKDIT